MQELANFPFNDWHIESILLGADTVKIAFHTWDDKQYNIVFRDSFYLANNSGMSGDIGEVSAEILEKNTSKEYDKILESYSDSETPYLIRFFDSWNDDFAVLTIAARQAIPITPYIILMKGNLSAGSGILNKLNIVDGGGQLMCMSLYIGSDNELPLIEWRENETHICGSKLDVSNKEDCFASEHLTKRNIYYIGSWQGCSFTFDYTDELYEKDEHDRIKQSVESLFAYIKENFIGKECELFSFCMGGRYNGI